MEDEFEIDKVSIWSKKPEELTVGEQVKLGVGVTVVCTVAPLIVLAAISGAAHGIEKLRQRRAEKKEAAKNAEEK